ncbi:MAG: hypothetical protein AB2A00_41070 [Myxococcota bacterium]
MSTHDVNGRRVVEKDGRKLGVTVHRVGTRFSCRVDNVDPGDVIGRGSGATVEEAEQAALANALMMLSLSQATHQLRQSMKNLGKDFPSKG